MTVTTAAHRISLVPFGEPATEALAATIADLKAGDPLAPVSVVVPSPYAGLSLRRALPSEHGPLVNVRFLTVPSLAELLAAPSLALAGRRPLTAPVRLAAVRASIAADPGPFGHAAGSAATERAVDRAVGELAKVPVAQRREIAAVSAVTAHLVRLHDAVRERTAGWYGHADLLEAAAEVARGGAPALADVGAVVVHLPSRLGPAERTLVEALAASAPVRVLIGLTGDAAADTAATALATDLGGALGPAAADDAAAVPVGTLVARAPDPAAEVRAAARWLVGLAEGGVPLHRTAVLYRHAEPYALLLHEELAAAGLPHNGRGTRTLAQSLTGRTLLGLLDLPERDFRRADVTAWLSAAPVLEHAGGPGAPASAWDGRARRAGVVAGRAQWEQRLRFLEAEAEARAAGEGASPPPTVELSARLRAFVAELVDGAAPARASWSELAAWARRAVRRYLGPPAAHGRWTDHDREEHAAVLSAVDALSGLDAVGGAASAPAFRRALEHELSAAPSPVGRFGEGVFLGTLADACGMSFEAVAVVGMAEGRFPPRHDEHALLPDDAGVAAAGALSTSRERRARERRDYLAALASAPVRRLSWPAADPRAQRPEAPSRWLLESASAHHGAPLSAAGFARLPAADWCEAPPSREAALLSSPRAASAAEHRLRVLTAHVLGGADLEEHGVASGDPVLVRGVAAARARASGEFTPWDGHVGPLRPLAEVGDGSGSVSPTSLETWATCPFRYFMGRFLGLRTVEDPDDVDSISAIDRGRLVHTVLEKLVREGLAPTEPHLPWSDAARRRVEELAAEECDRYERGGRTGSPLRWRLERERIVRELDRVLDVDDVHRAETGVVPVAVEMPFGGDSGVAVSIRLPSGREVGFHGFADRVDVSPDGRRVVVTDYKTGRPLPQNALSVDPVLGGTMLQLPVYALAARAAFGGESVTSGYWFVSERGGFARQGYDLDEAVAARFAEVVEVVHDGIDAGVFPARPGDEDLRPGVPPSFKNCRFCEFDRVCTSDRDEAWDRKRHAPEVAAYVRLSEGEA